MITRRLFLSGILAVGALSPAVVDARSLMRVKVPGVWVPEPWTLVPGHDYDGPWYERVGENYRVWSADNMRTFWRNPDLGYLSSRSESRTTVVNQTQFDVMLAYYKETPGAKWIHKHGHHDPLKTQPLKGHDFLPTQTQGFKRMDSCAQARDMFVQGT
jgi:hypothetical protein